METRVQQALDGDLTRAQLTAEEAVRLDQAEAMIGNVLRTVPVQGIPDLSDMVLRRIAAQASGKRAHTDLWFLRPRSFSLTLRPAYVMGLAAMFAFLLLTRPPRSANIAATVSSAAPATAAAILVQFKLDAPRARTVKLAGDFSDWQPSYELKRTEPGIWTIVVPLNPGVHDYAFIVDGERWVPDPMAPAVEDGFGGKNSRLAVLAPDARSL